MPDVFFLVEERSDGVSKAGQVPQPVGACEPGLGDLSKLTAPTYLWGKVNVCHCCVFRSCPIVKVCHCENFLFML